MSKFRYRLPWPASQISKADLSILFSVREHSPERTPITHLIAQAIRTQYGQLVNHPSNQPSNPRKTYMPELDS
jgi:hypothetical protein